MLLRTVFQIDRLDILNETIRTILFEMYLKHLHVSWARVVDVWKALIKMYGRNEDYEFAFEMISFVHISF
jgi:hypothetical protein